MFERGFEAHPKHSSSPSLIIPKTFLSPFPPLTRFAFLSVSLFPPFFLMNTLPSPAALKPMPSDSAYVSYHHPSSHHDFMKTLVASSWHSLEQVCLRSVFHLHNSHLLSSHRRPPCVKFWTLTSSKATVTVICSWPCCPPRAQKTRYVSLSVASDTTSACYPVRLTV